MAHDEASRLATLQEVALAVNASLDLDEVLAMILERACALLAAHKGSILLVDAEEQVLTIAVAHGLAPEVIAATRVPLGEGIAGAVALSGEPRRLAKGTREREGRTVDVAEALCVPLQVGGAVIGVLNVADRLEADEFDDDDLRLALLFAAQSAVAINNARAYEEQQRQAAELRALQQVSLAINERLDVHDTLREVLGQATGILRARQGSVMLIDEADQTLGIAVAHGLSDEVVAGTRVPLGTGIAGEVALTGRPRNLAGGVKAAGSQKAGADLAAALCVPLAVQGNVIGVLNVSDRVDGGNFSEHDLELLITLGRQAALAIHNARLYDDVSQRLDELGSLNEISRVLTGTLDRDQVLQLVVDEALRLLDCERGSLMLLQTGRGDEAYDPDQPCLGEAADPERHLEIVVAQGLSQEVVESTRIRLGEGIAGQVAATGEAVVLGPGQVDRRSSSGERSASLCLPLRAQQQIIGVLNLSGQRDGLFTPAQVQLAATLAAQA
ncbi:MAG: GAF domain-containing protein, partial [Armatimonadetes bacterium]|nr:GAF domain-containing protein [Armatimonadota bacterium]